MDGVGLEGGRVVEIRRYDLHPGMRERMWRRFDAVNRPIFTRLGMRLVWAVDDLTDANRVWIALTFATEGERDQAWAAYHEEPEYLAGREDQAGIIRGIVVHLVPVDQVPGSTA